MDNLLGSPPFSAGIHFKNFDHENANLFRPPEYCHWHSRDFFNPVNYRSMNLRQVKPADFALLDDGAAQQGILIYGAGEYPLGIIAQVDTISGKKYFLNRITWLNDSSRHFRRYDSVEELIENLVRGLEWFRIFLIVQ